FAASLLSVAALAQSTTVETETVTAGLLGKRYVAAGFGWTDIHNSSVEGMGAGLSLNVPVHTNFDVSLGYGYSWLEGVIGVAHTAGTTVTGYITRGQDKYFASAGIGYAWCENLWDKDHGIWDASVGVERAVTDKLSLTTSVSYGDDFGQHRDSQWDVSLGATYNFTAKLVGTAEVSYIERGSIGYYTGVAYRF
ncbi:MAG TPA: hypothetical protein PK322_03225, partial [Opitutaceae bacterium]|nr:hypothetical protein [Opitutaceae bacterium]